MFYDTFVHLCWKNGMSANAAASEMGLSSAAVTKWKQGSEPNSTTLAKVADYFGVDLAYLRHGVVCPDDSDDYENKNAPTVNDGSRSTFEEIMLTCFDLDENARSRLLSYARFLRDGKEG